MEVTKLFSICAGHRLLEPYSKRCENLHGHNYVIELCLTGLIDKTGMVIDFSKIKDRFNYIIDAFDHSLIVNMKDTTLVDLAPTVSSRHIILSDNPTAENMAQFFYSYLSKVISFNFNSIMLTSIKVWETPTSYATCYGNESKDNNIKIEKVSTEIFESWSLHQRNEFTEINFGKL